MLNLAEKIGLAVMIFVLMAGMGATLSWNDFRMILRKPVAVLAGFVSQFLFMPLLAFLLAKSLSFEGAVAISMILVGCTPGGTTSNLFTYFARGDVALSIAMTVASTFAAVFMMPLLLLAYGTGFAGAEFRIPYGNIITTLVLIILPAAIGMEIRRRSHQTARKVEQAGSYAGMIVIVFLIAEMLIQHNSVLLQASPKIYLAAVSLGLAGFLAGFVFSRLLKFDVRRSKTIALETGIQNTPLTMAIILASFESNLHPLMMVFPIVYALFIVIDSALVSLFFRYWKRAEN